MSAVQLHSEGLLRGDLTVIRRDARTGAIVTEWAKKNVITFGAATAMVRLLAPNAAFGADVQEQSQIRSLRLGTSSLSPQRSDTGLAAEASVLGVPVRIALLDASRVVGIAGTIEFVAVLDASTGNGVTYREACLFTRGTSDDPLVTTGATAFSRQAFPDQPKTSAVELEFRWRITITA